MMTLFNEKIIARCMVGATLLCMPMSHNEMKVSAVDPLYHMEDAYGAIGIDNIMGGDAKTRSGAVLDDSRFVRKLGVVRIPDGKTY